MTKQEFTDYWASIIHTALGARAASNFVAEANEVWYDAYNEGRTIEQLGFDA